MSCPSIKTEGNKYKCFWNAETNPQYRPAQEWYYFTLHMNNSLGQNEYKYTFDHYANSKFCCFLFNEFVLFLIAFFFVVLPESPQNLSVINVTTNSIYLNWSLPEDVAVLGIHFEHRLLYQCENGPNEWTVRQLIKTF